MATIKLTPAQRETLRVISSGDWFPQYLVDTEFSRTFPSLIRRGLLERRGGRATKSPVEVTITVDGLRAIEDFE